MYSFIGWFNVTLLAVLTGPYWVPRLIGKVLKKKDKRYYALIKFIRTVHKPLGLTVLILAPLHGYLALGGFSLHTGSLLFIWIVFTSISGFIFTKTKKIALLKFHQTLALIVATALALHLIDPGALRRFIA